MNKDVIYIDVEDDITAIIGKVKASKEKVVALVPPKRVGVLQSAVNLRLLQRSAKQSDKRLVLITNNQALIALSAAAQLPVAKNLQSKPEVAEISALEVDDENDVIDGAQLPVGELARTADEPAQVGDEISLTGIKLGEDDSPALKKADAPAAGERPSRPKAKKGSRVPNFNRFRKKLVLIIAGAILLLGFLVWAIFFAGRATIEITAKTTSVPLSQTVSLVTSAVEAEEEDTLQVVKQEVKKEEAVEFEATGKENRGEKATGTVEFSTSSLGGLGTIPAGTKLKTSGGLVFVTDSAVTLAFQGGPSSSGSTTVEADERGSKYNAANGNLSGAPSGVHAELTGPTSGGTDKNVTIVTAGDVQKAAGQLAEKEDSEVKTQLQAAFGKGVKVIETSYRVTKSDPVSSPAVGEEAKSNVKLSTTVTYSMYGVSESELGGFLDKTLEKAVADRNDQQAYDNGADKATFTDFSAKKKDISVKITANGQIGPKIDEAKLKEEVKGMRYGEVQSKLEAIDGVDKANTKFWPFWVSHVPGDTKRITIEFKVDESQ